MFSSVQFSFYSITAVAQCCSCSAHPRDAIIPHTFSEAEDIDEIASASISISTTASASTTTSSSSSFFEPKMVHFHNRVKVNEYTRWGSPQLGASINEMVKRNYEQRHIIRRFIQSWDLERQSGHLHKDLCTILDRLQTWEDPDDIIVFKREYKILYSASAIPRTSRLRPRSPRSADDSLSMSRSASSDTATANNTISYPTIPIIDIDNEEQICKKDMTKDGDMSVVDMIEIAYRNLGVGD